MDIQFIAGLATVIASMYGMLKFMLKDAHKDFDKLEDDGSCDLTLKEHSKQLAIIKCELEEAVGLDDSSSLEKLRKKLENSMSYLLLKKKADTKKALKAIDEGFFPLIQELQYFIDKQNAMMHLDKRYTVILKKKEQDGR